MGEALDFSTVLQGDTLQGNLQEGREQISVVDLPVKQLGNNGLFSGLLLFAHPQAVACSAVPFIPTVKHGESSPQRTLQGLLHYLSVFICLF